MSLMSKLRQIDFYRKIPDDLTEATSVGIALSMFATLFICVLIVVEICAFLFAGHEVEVAMDADGIESRLRIHFNITMMELPCEYASIDLLDVLGSNNMNVNKNINKWHLNSEGVIHQFDGRNRKQRDIAHDDHHPDLAKLHENGIHAIPLTTDTYETFLAEHDFVFIDFFAPWCVWCQRLAPTWETLAETIEKQDAVDGVSHPSYRVATVDCVSERELCTAQHIHAFPTLRMFRRGQPIFPEYRDDRTVEKMLTYAKNVIRENSVVVEEGETDAAKAAAAKAKAKGGGEEKIERVGCMLSGILTANRVPGNFHIEPRSLHHDFDASFTNMSHIVNHLSFGERPFANRLEQLAHIPSEHLQFTPMDGNVYVDYELHQAYHHVLKIVPTTYELSGSAFPGLPRKKNKKNKRPWYQFWPSISSSSSASSSFGSPYDDDDLNFDSFLGLSTVKAGTTRMNQVLAESQLNYYETGDVPEARFSYDLSPIVMIVRLPRRKWYDLITSLAAIVGGTFTVLGIIDAGLVRLIKPKKM